MSSVVITPSTQRQRDPRIDVFRGAALMMIFADHIPDDVLNRVTMHNFGFSDAAEVFVLLAGVSAMLAYGRAFEREGPAGGLRRVWLRCGKIYLFQAALLVTTFLVVRSWTNYYHLQSAILGPMLGHPVAGIVRGLALGALPSYLDILPLYVVLLGCFPVIYFAIRRNAWVAAGVSAAIWLWAALDHRIDLPNWLDSNGWYFDPFSWQFLFTLGCLLSLAIQRSGGALPRWRWLATLCWAYLAFAFMQGASWQDWSMPDLRPISMAFPDKSRLNPLRLLDVMSLFYLLLSSPRVRTLASSRWLRPLDLCGRHSLEVFSLSCVIALFARLCFRTYGVSVLTEVAVNVGGIGSMYLAALWLEHGKRAAQRVSAARAVRAGGAAKAA